MEPDETVERVVKDSPQPQVIFVSTYSGWISGFISLPYLRVWVGLLREPQQVWAKG